VKEAEKQTAIPGKVSGTKTPIGEPSSGARVHVSETVHKLTLCLCMHAYTSGMLGSGHFCERTSTGGSESTRPHALSTHASWSTSTAMCWLIVDAGRMAVILDRARERDSTRSRERERQRESGSIAVTLDGASS
jgi:hypothetical protein